jgi:Regulator of chromosome condensation (RCC1) repeat
MKHTVVYAMGEGWTGALGTGRLDQRVPGHLDDDDDDPNEQGLNPPVVLFDSSVSNMQNPLQQQRLLSCAVGWGHTALLVESKIPHSVSNEMLNGVQHQLNSNVPALSPEDFTTSTQLLVTGRPHEFASLLRLKRMPQAMRQYVTDMTYRTILRAKITEKMIEENDPNKNVIGLNPIDIIGRMLTYLSKEFGDPKTNPNWSVARDQSFLLEPTKVPLPFNSSSSSTDTPSSALQVQTELWDLDPTEPIPNDIPVHVTCSAGITAFTTTMGCVYTFGLNAIGQCGIGKTSNNVWEPSRVTGLSREFCARGYRATDLPQSYPIQQTALGLQRT